jgi:hypothetical protein
VKTSAGVGCAVVCLQLTLDVRPSAPSNSSNKNNVAKQKATSKKKTRKGKGKKCVVTATWSSWFRENVQKDTSEEGIASPQLCDRGREAWRLIVAGEKIGLTPQQIWEMGKDRFEEDVRNYTPDPANQVEDLLNYLDNLQRIIDEAIGDDTEFSPEFLKAFDKEVERVNKLVNSKHEYTPQLSVVNGKVKVTWK